LIASIPAGEDGARLASSGVSDRRIDLARNTGISALSGGDSLASGSRRRSAGGLKCANTDVYSTGTAAQVANDLRSKASHSGTNRRAAFRQVGILRFVSRQLGLAYGRVAAVRASTTLVRHSGAFIDSRARLVGFRNSEEHFSTATNLGEGNGSKRRQKTYNSQSSSI